MIKLSVCIPAYNRHQFIKPLLDSIIAQDYDGLEIVICEDKSPERELIREEVEKFISEKQLNTQKIKLFENEKNLGYDKNFRELLTKASGDYCLFMGNDDILNEGSIEKILEVLKDNDEIAVISRAYQWFYGDISNIRDTARHLSEDTLFEPGLEAIRFFYRRVGVLSGLVFKKDVSLAVETDKFDGHLYYQMYLAGMLLKNHKGFYISRVQTLSRDGIAPDFGNAEVEKANFQAGTYTYMARVHMVKGLLKIAEYIDDSEDKKVFYAVKKDIASYFYPYISDQLNLPIKNYIHMIQEYRKIGMNNEKLFYIHCILGYIFKRKGYDYLIKSIRKILGRSPRIGF